MPPAVVEAGWGGGARSASRAGHRPEGWGGAINPPRCSDRMGCQYDRFHNICAHFAVVCSYGISIILMYRQTKVTNILTLGTEFATFRITFFRQTPSLFFRGSSN